MVIGFGAILLLLVTLVTDASVIFLAQRSLTAAADGAAVYSANAADEGLVYAGGDRTALPLSDASVRAAVRSYVDRAGLADGRFPVSVARADTDGTVATVTFRSRVPLPFVHFLPVAWARGYPLASRASARAPLLD